MNIVLTGFEPFGERTVNTSWDLIKEFPATFQGHTVTTVLLPVEYEKAWQVLGPVVEKIKPDILVSFGESPNKTFDMERVAVNLRDCERPDNAGCLLQDQVIVPNSSPAYFSELPIRAMLQGLEAADIPATLSLSAGSYLCNEIFYCNMHHSKDHPSLRAGFIHVPFAKEGIDPLSLYKSHPVEVMLSAICM